MVDVEVNSQQVAVKGELDLLVEEYLKTGNEYYFNMLWEKVKAFSISIGKKFVTIPFEDKQNIAMEVLFRCIPKVQNNKGKLLTYYGFALRGEYICWLEKCETYKYKVNSEAYSLDKMEEDVNYQPTANIDDFSLTLFFENCHLLGAEAIMVSLLNEGYNKGEIMDRMKLKREDYDSLLNKIRNKIRINYLDEKKEFTL